ncbi:MAG TPA: hypothetical protein VFP61_09740 [Acidimicrobiales bacterium]|nr:hypothetical protein [Acidimicrobiales bacterium]
MNKRTLLVLPAAVAAVVFSAAPAGAATTLPASGSTGADISYPQCGGSYASDLSGESFGIVGVNGGRPMEVNGCLDAELTWEQHLNGGATPSSPQLYVNTADPGNTVADWPARGSTPYGDCLASHRGVGENSTACAYLYGVEEANYDLTEIGGTAAAAGYQWWLDVETANSWQGRHNLEMNQASLDGMLSVLPHGQVGVYSTSYQWGQIVGSNLDGVSKAAGLGTLDEWIPTGLSAPNCGLPTFTSGRVVYSQYATTTNGTTYDADYAC